MASSVILTAAATPAAPALRLRPWCEDDVPTLVAAFRDPALRRWGAPPMADEADGLRWVRAQQEGWAKGERFAFAVVAAVPGGGTAQVVGNVMLKDVAPGKPSAEVGYWTAAAATGRGIAPRALGAVTTWAFDAFRAHGLERIELLHQVDNPASCRVAEKSGYLHERTLPAFPPTYPLDGHVHVRRDAAD
jgi:RimJ/RimL family protein N-acetyltransferase